MIDNHHTHPPWDYPPPGGASFFLQRVAAATFLENAAVTKHASQSLADIVDFLLRFVSDPARRETSSQLGVLCATKKRPNECVVCFKEAPKGVGVSRKPLLWRIAAYASVQRGGFTGVFSQREL
jgi:hypothetical protein